MNKSRFSRNRSSHKDKVVHSTEQGDDKSIVVNCFEKYAEELIQKHDRYERITKMSRDITIEAKRLIFLLHAVDLRNSNSEKLLSDAFDRLLVLCNKNFMNISKEIVGYDHYQYARAYSAGLQEFIEAFTYYNYLKNEHIIDWNGLQLKLTYRNHEETVDDGLFSGQQMVCLVQPNEYMLGLADLSGEIMRKCIYSVGSGDVDACHNASKFVQCLYSG